MTHGIYIAKTRRSLLLPKKESQIYIPAACVALGCQGLFRLRG
jgi:hypothetical protein